MLAPILLDAHNPGPMTGAGNNTFLIVGSHGTATLIDAGQGSEPHLRGLAEQLHRRSARLERVLVTHAHVDHAHGAHDVARAHPTARFQKFPWPGEDQKFGVDWEDLSDGDVVDIDGDSLVVLHTPGHSPDHLVFWHEASRTLFSGDMVIATGSVMIHSSRGGDLAQYLSSLERLRAMSPARMLPAHGPVLDDPVSVLTQYIDHRLEREVQVMSALTAGRQTVEAIAESIYDGLNPALLPAAHETVRAHLDKLRRERRAEVHVGRWSPA